MPCYDPRDNEPCTTREEYYADFEHNSPVAALLCDACKFIIDGEPLSKTRELSFWWQAHLERDRKRKKTCG